MARAGCRHITYGIDTLDPAAIRKVGRGLSTERIHERIRLNRRCGIRVKVNFMFGFPWDTVETLRETFGQIRAMSRVADEIATHGIVIPLPATPLYEDYKDRHGFEKWWLRPEDYGIFGYMDRAEQPLFRKRFFDDYGFPNCFGHSPAVMGEIRRIAEYLGRLRVRRRNVSSLLRTIDLAAVRISRALYGVSPAAERCASRSSFSPSGSQQGETEPGRSARPGGSRRRAARPRSPQAGCARNSRAARGA